MDETTAGQKFFHDWLNNTYVIGTTQESKDKDGSPNTVEEFNVNKTVFWLESE